jgi:predicted outer membrane protein
MGSRRARAIVIVAICISITTAVALTWRIPSTFTGIGYAATPTGPLGPADKDLLYRVKQAGLWEMPLGDEVSEKAMTPKLREVAKKISKEHHELDKIVNEKADILGVSLPSEATAEQRAWMAELSALPQGMSYDHLAVHRLREAHGTILPLLAQIYSTTRNDTIRDTAKEGMVFVSRHISYMEETGLVNHSQLPEPPQPKPLLSPVKESYYAVEDRPSMIFAGAVIVLCLLGASYIIHTLFRGRKKTR